MEETHGNDTIFIACDHAGYELKHILQTHLESKGHKVVNLGCNSSEERVDYPQYGKKLGEEVVKSGGRGVLVCGSGIGISIAANKCTGIRCALVHDYYGAEMSRKHNDANVIAFGGRVTGVEVAKQCLDVWLVTEFEKDHPNHPRRVSQLDA
mmetsp:Transcript_1621/g.1724  ORF Transcript_1621/g.1724 Transcript_1621/m.1724 type:complete len:152 (+) Transcript_1621:249-704(+)